MKLSLTLAGAVLIGSTLAACGGGEGGGGEGGDYCKDIKSAAKSLDSITGGDVSQIEAGFETVHKLAEQAPNEVKDDWKVLDGAISSLQDALADAGIRLGEIADSETGEVPQGVDTSKLTGIATEVGKFRSADFTEASKAIETHAKDVCKVDLNAS